MNALTDLIRVESEASRLASTVRKAIAQIGQSPQSRSVLTQIEESRQRRRLFGSPIGDPSWEILLDLYRAAFLQLRISVSSACIASGAPHSTALRHLVKLVGLGYIERCHDPDDARRVFVRLSPLGLEQMGLYFDSPVTTPDRRS